MAIKNVRLLSAGLSAAAVLAGLICAILGWGVSRKVTAPVRQRSFPLEIRGVEREGEKTHVVLKRTNATTAIGVYNLWFEHGGWVQLGDEIHDRGPGCIARTVTGSAAGLVPFVGDRVSWSGIYFASPHDAGLDAHEIMIETNVGPAPAWHIDGESSVWAIHIHGLGSIRESTLRGVQVATELGLSSLVVSYRNDGVGPQLGAGRSMLGATEMADVDAAISYAVCHGAQQIVLFGWSLGAAIALQLAHRSQHAPLITALVLDSPVLDWGAVITANCVRSKLPAVAGRIAMPWLRFGMLARVVGLSQGIRIRDFDWLRQADGLAVPTLILHGVSDDSVPYALSEDLHARRPDLVSLRSFTAGHTLPWNTDCERWRADVKSWLAAHLMLP